MATQNLKITATTILLFLSHSIFSQTDWFKVGSAPNKYETTVDSSNQHEGKNVMTLKSVESNIKGFGALMQNVKPGQYLGKRIRMTGYLKSNDVITLSIKSRKDDRYEFLRSHDFRVTVDDEAYQEVMCHDKGIGTNDEV